MPYSIKKKGSDFAVIKKSDGSTVPGGRHQTQEKAEAPLKALFANIKSTDNSPSDMNKEILQCRASGAEIKVSQPWKQGEQASFCYMPSGVHNITAGFRGKAINITVNVHEGTANKVQASFESLKAEAPKQHPFGDIEHDEKEASFHPVNFSWGDHLGEQGVICSCEPTSLGERNVNGKIHRSFSPSFATDADYSKAKLQDGVYTFPEGVRGSQANPAEVIGIDFCVGTLTNKPAFRAMPPVKAKKTDAVTAGAPVGNRNAAKDRDGNSGREQASQTAEAATAKADKSGNPEHHAEAAKLHTKAMDAYNRHVDGSQEPRPQSSRMASYHRGEASYHENMASGQNKFEAARNAMKASKPEVASSSIRAAAQIADQPAPSSDDYADLAKKAEFKTAVAKAADKVFPDGEAHGKKFHLHTEAAMAQKAAADTCEDEDCKAEHQEQADEHLACAEEHGKIIAKDESKDETVIKAGGPGSGRHSESYRTSPNAQDDKSAAFHKNEASKSFDKASGEGDNKTRAALHASGVAHLESHAAFKSGNPLDHKGAEAAHNEAAQKLKAAGQEPAAKAHEEMAAHHASHFAALGLKNLKASQPEKLTSDSVLASIKGAKLAPVKIADSQSILASLARAKSN